MHPLHAKCGFVVDNSKILSKISPPNYKFLRQCDIAFLQLHVYTAKYSCNLTEPVCIASNIL